MLLSFFSRSKPGRARCLQLCIFLLASATLSSSYSVLSHEEVVDLLWVNPIVPLLQQRFPNATPEDIRKAHAYAYGGCLIQDMGYYPLGNHKFSDLVHYVRSGDFIQALFDESTDLDEYAFALGALAHYASDVSGHPVVNEAVALRFPKLRKKFGDLVTYEDDPKTHIRTEFGFDVVQVAKNRYAPDAYHDFIGFEVAKPLLERGFRRTYGLELSDVFKDLDLSIGTYRRSVSKVIPEMTRVALLTKRADLVREVPNFNEKHFLYHVSRAQYVKQWGNNYKRPGFGARFLAFLFHLVPKVGPFKAIDFVLPTTKTEDMYLKSVNQTLDSYRHLLLAEKGGRLQLDNRDFDTGKATKAGEYRLTDESYADLVGKIAQKNFAGVTPDLRQNILSFYSDPAAPVYTKKTPGKWRALMAQLNQLRAAQVAGPPSEQTPSTN
jgi:hypothetical protein